MKYTKFDKVENRGAWLLHGQRYATFEEFRAALIRRVMLSALIEK